MKRKKSKPANDERPADLILWPQQHAIALRDAALRLVERSGKWEAVGSSKLNFLVARMGSLTLMYRTPFQPLPATSDQVKHRAAQLGIAVPDNLPYGLDIWSS